MSNDSSASDAPFGEVEFPKKEKSPFSVAPGSKAAAAAASVRASIMEPGEDFAGAPQGQRTRPKEGGLGELPDIDDFAQPAKSISAAQSIGEIPQLVLKAIFGVSEEMDQAEILRRARALPKIKNVSLLGTAEQQALEVLQKSFSGNGALTFQIGGDEIDFIKEPGVTLAVSTNGAYAAGVRETLIIVARELARLT